MRPGYTVKRGPTLEEYEAVARETRRASSCTGPSRCSAFPESDDLDAEEPKPKMCDRCGAHPDDLKCLDHHVGDELRPMQTKLCRMLNDETLPHAVRGEILDAADSLGRAMQAARDCMPNAAPHGRDGRSVP